MSYVLSATVSEGNRVDANRTLYLHYPLFDIPLNATVTMVRLTGTVTYYGSSSGGYFYIDGLRAPLSSTNSEYNFTFDSDGSDLSVNTGKLTCTWDYGYGSFTLSDLKYIIWYEINGDVEPGVVKAYINYDEYENTPEEITEDVFYFMEDIDTFYGTISYEPVSIPSGATITSTSVSGILITNIESPILYYVNSQLVGTFDNIEKHYPFSIELSEANPNSGTLSYAIQSEDGMLYGAIGIYNLIYNVTYEYDDGVTGPTIYVGTTKITGVYLGSTKIMDLK